MYPTFSLWLAAADAALQARYAVTYEQAGADNNELLDLYHEHLTQGQTVQDAASEYGSRRDLIDFDPWTMADLAAAHPIPAPPAWAADLRLTVLIGPGDPNYGGERQPGEAFFSGSGGTVTFEAATGRVLRHFPGRDFGPHHDGYLDIAQVDVAALSARFKNGAPIETGDCFDVLVTTTTTYEGKVLAEVPAEELDPA